MHRNLTESLDTAVTPSLAIVTLLRHQSQRTVNLSSTEWTWPWQTRGATPGKTRPATTGLLGWWSAVTWRLVPSACCRRTLVWTALTTPERQSIFGEQSYAWQYVMSGKEFLSAVQVRTRTRPCGWRGSLRGLGTEGHASEGVQFVELQERRCCTMCRTEASSLDRAIMKCKQEISGCDIHKYYLARLSCEVNSVKKHNYKIWLNDGVY